MFAVNLMYAQTPAQRQEIKNKSNVQKLNAISKRLEAQEKRNYQLALRLAKNKKWPLEKFDEKGSKSKLVGVKITGKDTVAIYHTNDNRGAGITSRANTLYPGGSLGLNVTGNGMTLGLWEIDAVLASHELFEGRVNQVDSDTPDSHATHVAGTIIGSPNFKGGAAKGMAYEGRIRAFNSSYDESEVASEAANGNLLSSHSYGITARNQPEYYLGKYDANARNYDEIMYNAPYYLGVFSAGNDRGKGITPSGYDLLTDMSCNKNGLTVAAIYEVSNYTGPSSVNMSSFSSWGPTDDGRIKPDISAKGVDLYSSTNTSNSSYQYMSGTSMATPSTSGTLMLIQQHYYNVNNSFMKSATLRGLVLHTADEAGSSDGPDYEYGWGLLNAEKAAKTITEEGTQSIIKELELNSGGTYTINVTASGLENLMASIAWTDKEGTVGANYVNDRTPNLVNDLDIRITKSGTTYYPWKLNPAYPSSGATKGDNKVDNIEKIDIANASGQYTITITHKGSLYSGKQAFSLIITGINVSVVDCNGVTGGSAYLDNCDVCVGGNTGLTPCAVACNNYCTSKGDLSYQTSITTVNFNTINKISSKTAYSDYTGLSTDVVKGNTYNLSVNLNTDGAYTIHSKVWIDWNKDCDFDDAGEEYNLGSANDVTNGPTSASPLSITIPSNAVLGEVRMRVSCKYNAVPIACEVDFDGEVEDYTINITEPSVSNCTTTISTYPSVISFENGWEGFSQSSDDDFDWIRHTGSTPSTGTGPTSGNNGSGYYIYTEASSPNNPNLSAKVLSPCYNLADLSSPKLEFAYHMLGDAVGTLTVKISDDNGANWTSIWNKSGTQGSSWSTAEIDLSSYTGSTVNFMIDGLNNGWSSDFSIDDFSVSDVVLATDCNGVVGGTAYLDDCATCVGGNTGLTACTQDCNGDWGGTAYNDNCNTCVGGSTGLIACTQDCNGDWGGTAYLDNCATCVGGNTGLLACVDACDNYCTSNGDMSYQTSTTLVNFNTLNNSSGKSAYSDYTNLSTDLLIGNSYTLTVNVNTDGSYTIYSKVWIDWNKDCDFDDAGEEYNLGSANGVSNGATSLSPLSITVPSNAVLGSVRMRVSSKYNAEATSCETSFDGEVEDYTINITNNTTPINNCNAMVSTYPNVKTFESGVNDFEQLSDDDFDWIRHSGSTPSTGTGPNSGNSGSTNYMYMEASSPNYPDKYARMMSPCYDLQSLSSPKLQFSYHMFGTSVGSLSLKISDDNGETWSAVLWNKSGSQGDQWITEIIDLSAYNNKTVNFLVEGVTGGWSSDMAIDDFQVYNAVSARVESNDIELLSEIEDNNKEISIEIFPNPNNGQFELHLPFNEIAEIRLFDLSGKVVYAQKSNNKVVKFDLDLSAGVYILKANTSAEQSIKRVVINK